MAQSGSANEPEPKLLKVSEVARLLRLSKATVYTMIHNGALPHRVINGRNFRVPASAVRKELGEDD